MNMNVFKKLKWMLWAALLICLTGCGMAEALPTAEVAPVAEAQPTLEAVPASHDTLFFQRCRSLRFRLVCPSNRALSFCRNCQ